MDNYKSVMSLLEQKLSLLKKFLSHCEDMEELPYNGDVEVFEKGMQNIDDIIGDINRVDSLLQIKLKDYEDEQVLISAIKNEGNRGDFCSDVVVIFDISQNILSLVNKIQGVYNSLSIKFNDIKESLLNNIKKVNRSNEASKYLAYNNDEDIILNFKYDKI